MGESEISTCDTDADEPGGSEPRVDSTLTKGLSLLDALAASPSGRGVSDLARELGLTKSNAFRLLQTLVHLGFVQRSEDKLYTATLKTWRMGLRVVENLDLPRLAKDEMRALSEATGETVYLAVPQGLSVVYVDMIDSVRPIRSWNRIGGSAPIHCVSTGKAILAADFPSFRGRLEKAGLAGYTDRSIVTMSGLEADVAATIRDGYAYDAGEFRAGVIGTAAAILLPSGGAVAAIGLSLVEGDLREHGREKLGRLVRDAARRISHRLSGSQVV